MIIGIGTDVVAVVRMAALWQRQGMRLGRRILAPEELDGLARSSRPAHYLAKRFAAKEAFAKALGTGLGGGVFLRHIAVEHDGAGAPRLALSGQAAELLSARRARCHLSISDERDCAIAFVVIEADGIGQSAAPLSA
ncbi:MAG: holo-ACP synthase [Pseudomonadota bacterium]|nr:holo-ACP synthase [Pseudomonadota bacterium]